MNYKEITEIRDLDSFSLELHCAVDILSAIHIAMSEGNCVPASGWGDAIYGALMMLQAKDEELQGLVEYDNQRRIAK